MNWLIYFVYRLLVASWRIQVVEAPGLKKYLAEKKPVIFAHWHGDELALIYLVKRYGLSTMTSTSKDGAIVDFAIRKFGGFTARGSSTRGGAGALKGLIRLVKSGHNASIAVDGPRGPIYEPKAGVFELSRLCQVPIVPTGVAASPTRVFEKSWNKTYLPLPFARVIVVLDEPLPPLQTRPDSTTEVSAHLKACIDAARHQAGKIIAAR